MRRIEATYTIRKDDAPITEGFPHERLEGIIEILSENGWDVREIPNHEERIAFYAIYKDDEPYSNYGRIIDDTIVARDKLDEFLSQLDY